MRHLLLIRDLLGGKALALHIGKKLLFVGDAAVIVNVDKLGREELVWGWLCSASTTEK
jgi:hypothetical protein